MADADKDSDLGRTATLPAGTAPTPARSSAVEVESPASADIESPAHDLEALPVVDQDTYVFGGYFARGGMGRIAAVRDKRLGRVIAIKELIAKDPAYVARFRREIRITAQLQHPAIVSLLEAGQWPSGEPFFAMKKVQGTSLKEAIDARKSLDERLGLLASTIAIVDALAYAHDRGVIHRDLKPANVLVGEFGETVVIDWGLAKDLRATDDALEPVPMVAGSTDSQMTAAGSIMGTPSFMAPEQARGDETDERSDVYALGAILYTVLTGKPPYHGSTGAEVMQRVLADDPCPIAELEPRVPVDLQTIVARAMARDRSKRYPSAKELAADLKRFQTGQLVAAHRYTRGELFRRWVRRHRGAVLVGSVAAVALAGVGAASFTRIVRERDRARVAETDARARADALVLAQARAKVSSDPIGALASLAELSLTSQHWPAARLVASDAIARGLPQRIWEDAARELEVSPDGTLIAYAEGAELRLREITSGAERSLGRHEGDISDVEFSRDGKRLITGSQDNTAAIWTLDGASPRWLRGHSGYVTGVDFALDDTVALTTGLDQATRVWTLSSDEVRSVPAWLRSRFLSTDGRWLVAVEQQKGAAIWNVATGKRELELGERCAAFVPGTADVIIAGDKQVVLRNMNTGVEAKLGDLTDRCTDVVVTRSGGRVVIGTVTGALVVGDTSNKNQTWTYRGITGPVLGIEVRADGAWIAAWGARDSAVHLIDPLTRTGHALVGSRGEAMFTSDDRVFAFDNNRQLLAWKTTRGGARVFESNPSTRTAAVSRDGKLLATGAGRRGLRLVDLDSGKATDLSGMTPIHHVAISPNGALIATLSDDHRARLWERATGKSVEIPRLGQGMLVFSPDGNHLAAIGERDDVSLWSVATGQVRSLTGHAGNVFAIAFSPRGDELVSGAGDGTVRIWNVATASARVLGKHNGVVRRLAFTPDGAYVVAADEAGGVRVWPTSGGTARTFSGHHGWVLAVAVDPSGQWLATGGTDKTVRVWNLATNSSRTLGSHGDGILDVAFSPDGQTLASAALDGSVRLWDLASGAHRSLEGHANWVWQLAWFADGTRLATISQDGTARVWTDDLPRDPKLLREWLARTAK